MPHYTTFDVNPASQPTQVMTVPQASEPKPPTASQSTTVGSPLIISLPGPVQFKTGGVEVGTSPVGIQNADVNGGSIGSGGSSADVAKEPTKPMAGPSGIAKDGARADLVPLPPLPPIPPFP